MKSIRRDSDSSLIKATLFCLIAIRSPRRFLVLRFIK
ncbi:BnaC03g74000D [Brassica napus]|uniref:BnaC03g74000D protein n=1 Tax=Brassica napus TaxID=3708 RepID=A0A078ITR7_BRANA|nr:BnaC03g74000D [Brassica napus]